MKPRSSPSLLAVLALCGAGALASTGCGGAGSTIDPVAKAADVTSRADGAQILFTVEVSGEGLTKPLVMKGQGNFNFQSGEGDLALTMERLPPELASQVHASAMHMTEIYKGGVGYIGSPLFDGKLPGGARWLKIDLNQVLKSEGLNPSSLTNGGVNPSQYLEYLKAQGAKVTLAGHEVVRGVQTTRYSGTFDVVKASEQAPGADPALVRKTFAKALPTTADRNVPLSVWIDSHDLVRRLSMDITVEPEGRRGEFKLTMEFLDFGATPGVTTPPDSETFDITKSTLASSKSS